MGLTSTEWAALIAAGGAVLGAVAGGSVAGIVSYRITERQVTSSADEGKRQRTYDAQQRTLDRDHERTLSRSERRFDRRVDAYLALTTYVQWTDQFARWQKQVLIGWVGPEKPEPPQRPTENDASTNALAHLFLEPTTAAAVLDLNRLRREMQQAVDLTEVAQPGQDSQASFHAAQKAADALIRAVPSVLEALRKDLNEPS